MVINYHVWENSNAVSCEEPSHVKQESSLYIIQESMFINSSF